MEKLDDTNQVIKYLKEKVKPKINKKRLEEFNKML